MPQVGWLNDNFLTSLVSLIRHPLAWTNGVFTDHASRHNVSSVLSKKLLDPERYHIATGVFWVFTALLAFCILWSVKHDPFQDIPGPFLARWSPLWLAYQARRGRRYIAVDKLHKKYGTFVRISPNHISIAHKDALPVIYGQGQAAFHKSPFYDAFVCDEPSVFSTRDRIDHARRRRLVSQAFSYSALQRCTPFIHEILTTFVEKIDKICENGEEVDALLWFNYLAFDVLSNLAFGEAIGMVANGSDSVTVRHSNGSTTEEHAISLVDNREHLAAVLGLHPSFKIISRFLPDPFLVRGHRSSNGLIDLARRKVMKRLDSGAQREDILGRLISAHVHVNGSITTEQVDGLTAEAVTLLIAGSDTTSNSLTGIIHLIMTHPAVRVKLVRVLEDRVASELPEYVEIKDIPYLDATINEGLRYYATTAIGLHRSVPEGGTICCGKYFPPGTEVSVPAWTIQRDTRIWGDPEAFRPERWLESGNLQQCLLTFGKGPRACLGRNLAYMEMRLVLATIMLRYDVELSSDILETTEGFMHKPLRMMVRFKRRIP